MGIMTVEDKMRLVLALAEEGMKQGEVPIATIIFHEDDIISNEANPKHPMIAFDNVNYCLAVKK